MWVAAALRTSNSTPTGGQSYNTPGTHFHSTSAVTEMTLNAAATGWTLCRHAGPQQQLNPKPLAVLFVTTFWTFLYDVPAHAQMYPRIETHQATPVTAELAAIAPVADI